MKQYWTVCLLIALCLVAGGCKEDTGETTQADINGNVSEMKSDKSQAIKPDEKINDAMMMGGGK